METSTDKRDARNAQEGTAKCIIMCALGSREKRTAEANASADEGLPERGICPPVERRVE